MRGEVSENVTSGCNVEMVVVTSYIRLRYPNTQYDVLTVMQFHLGVKRTNHMFDQFNACLQSKNHNSDQKLFNGSVLCLCIAVVV